MAVFAVAVAALVVAVSAQYRGDGYQGDDMEIFKRKVSLEQFEDTELGSLEEIFAILDIDGDGYLNEEEQAFIAALLKPREERRDGPPAGESLDVFMKNAENLVFIGGKAAADVFAFADLDGNGIIEDMEHQILAHHVEHPEGGRGGPGGPGGPGGRPDDREEKQMDPEDLDTFLKNVEESNLKFVGDKTAEDIFNYADHDGDGFVDHDEQMFLAQLIERERTEGGPDDRRGPPPGGDMRGDPRDMRGDPRGGPPPGGDMRGDPRDMRGGGPPPGGDRGGPGMGGGMDEKMFQKRYSARLHGETVSEIFTKFDADGDGFLTQEEEKKAVKALIFGKDL